MLRIVFISIVQIVFCLGTLNSQPLFQLDNLDFEKGIVGKEPVSWSFPNVLVKLGYKAALTDSIKYSGNMSVMLINSKPIDFKSDEEDQNFCTIFQSVDAYCFKGKIIKFSIYAKLQADSPESKGEIWIMSRKSRDSVLLNVVDVENPIISNEWKKYEITATIPDSSKELRFGVILHGKGILYADNAKIDILNPENYIPIQTKSTLTINSVDAFKALADVYSQVRYFLPSDEAISIDWDRYLISHLSKINSESNDNNISNLLKDFIKPFSNYVQIDKTKILEKNIPKNVFDKISYSMLYRGGPAYYTSQLIGGERKNIYSVTRRREGSISQKIDLVKHDKKELRISCDMKVDAKSPGANAQFWIRIDKIGTKEYIARTSALNPVYDNKWTKRTISVELPDNVYDLQLALIFMGEGAANFDNIKIEIFEKGKKVQSLNANNYSFEDASKINEINQWNIDPGVIDAGYTFSIDNKDYSEGKSSLEISTDTSSIVNFPQPGYLYQYRINDSLTLSMPYCMFTDSVRTLPKSDFSPNYGEISSNINFSYRDLNTRIALLIQLYSVLKNFSITEIDQKLLDSAFYDLIPKISSNNDITATIQNFNSFLLLAKDSKIKLWNTFEYYDYGFPVLFRRIDNKFIITNNYDKNIELKPGDEILSINKNNISDLINRNLSFYHSANDEYNFQKAAAELRSGEKDSKVIFEVKSIDNNIRKIEVTRNEFLNNIYEPRPAALSVADTGVLYIDMTVIDDRQFKDIIDKLDDFHSFIFDLRGQSVMSEHILSLFTDKEIKSVNWEIPVYTYPNKQNQSKDIIKGKLEPKNKFKDKKLVFLINERTSGYSEVIAHIVKSNNLGVLVGTMSSGNASETYPIRLCGGFALSLSAMKCMTSDDKTIFNLPVIPDINIKYNVQDLIDGKEIFIENALRFLKK